MRSCECVRDVGWSSTTINLSQHTYLRFRRVEASELRLVGSRVTGIVPSRIQAAIDDQRMQRSQSERGGGTRRG